MTPDQINQDIWGAIWRTRGRAPIASDTDYWVTQGKFLECVNYRNEAYAISRVEGFESTGSDVPPYGPYANPVTPYFSPVPPFPGMAPVPSNSNSNLAPVDNSTILNQILSNQAEILANQTKILSKPIPSYEFDLFGVKVVLHPE